MIKHADSLNFFQVLKQRKEKERNQQLRPAWWTNAVTPEIASVVAGTGIGSGLLRNMENPNMAAPISAVQALINKTGLDVKPNAVDNNTVGSYAYAPHNTALGRAFGLSDDLYGAHGAILKHEDLKPRGLWNLPAAAHEVGHAEAAFGPKVFERLMAKGRVPGMLGSIAGTVEAFRALNNTSRPMDDRKRMLNKASLIEGAGLAPMLFDEYHASRNGLNLLKEVGNSPEIVNAARKFYPRAFGTYGLMAGAAIAAPQLAKLFLPKHVS